MAKSEKKQQHVVPASYLRPWCDPTTPPGQKPFIWRIPKDGGAPYKRSPEKSFRSNDRYTVRMADGTRDLTVEDSLGGLENRFVSLRQRITRGERLTFRDRANLCLFTTAMHTRTLHMGERWAGFNRQVLEQVEALQRQHGLGITPEAEVLRDSVQHAAPQFVMLNLEVQAPLLMSLNHSVLVTDDPVGFITSDSPCIWHLPDAHRLPPGTRRPALMHPTIEITLPLTPRHLLLMGHVQAKPYRRVPKTVVDELNRRARFYCEAEMISRSERIERVWFENREMPRDAWENTDEGRASLAQRKEWDEIRMQHQQAHARSDATPPSEPPDS